MDERAADEAAARVVPIVNIDPTSCVMREAVGQPVVAVTVWYGDDYRVIVDEGLTDDQAAVIALHAGTKHAPPPELRDPSFTVWDCVCGTCLWADAWVALLAVAEIVASTA